MVGLRNDAFPLHALDQRRRLVVADGEAALDIAGRRLLVGEDDVDGLVVELVARAAAAAVFERRRRIELFLFLGNRVEVVRGACAFRWRTTASTSPSETNGPCRRRMRPPPAM